jgi:hypothetical protein
MGIEALTTSVYTFGDLIEGSFLSVDKPRSNTRTVITGPDRFLVLCTDFKYGGERRKATVVQEVIVSPKD